MVMAIHVAFDSPRLHADLIKKSNDRVFAYRHGLQRGIDVDVAVTDAELGYGSH